jgi:hypothetical protein
MYICVEIVLLIYTFTWKNYSCAKLFYVWALQLLPTTSWLLSNIRYPVFKVKIMCGSSLTVQTFNHKKAKQIKKARFLFRKIKMNKIYTECMFTNFQGSF